MNPQKEEAGEQLNDLVAETRAEMGNGTRRTTRQEPNMANGEGEGGEKGMMGPVEHGGMPAHRPTTIRVYVGSSAASFLSP